MIGFFEHQYLVYKKDHIKNLLALAKADGFMHAKEEKMLYKIGKRYGLKDRQVKALIDSDEKYTLNVPNNHIDKMNLMYDIMLMVHADGVVEKNEIAFCEDVVKRLGLKKELVKVMANEIFEKGAPPTSEEWKEFIEDSKDQFSIKGK